MALDLYVLGKAGSPLTSLASGIDATQTTITVANAIDAFETMMIGQKTLGMISPFGLDSETVEITAINGNVLTVIRGADGTTSKAWSNGTNIARAIGRGDFEKIQNALIKHDDELVPKMTKVNGIPLIGDVDVEIANITGLEATLKASKLLIVSDQFTIPAASWVANAGNKQEYTYNNAKIKKTHSPEFAPNIDTIEYTAGVGLVPEAFDGRIVFTANDLPEGDINGTLYVQETEAL